MLPHNMTDELASSAFDHSNGCGESNPDNEELNASARRLLQVASVNCDQHVGLIFEYNLVSW